MKLFVSDLHLDPERPATLNQFRACLDRYKAELTELYILGDLFEYWIGDDHLTETALATATLLKSFNDHGVEIFFMAGNRDFLLGPDYAALCHMQLLEDGSIIDLDGVATILSHGDHLCTDDQVYQAVRAKVRSPQWQQAVLAQPIDARLAMANQARGQSKAHTSEADMTIMDVNAEAVVGFMAEAGVVQMIHGHTHRPALHELTVNGQAARRWVLGDWYTDSGIRVLAGHQLVNPLR